MNIIEMVTLTDLPGQTPTFLLWMMDSVPRNVCALWNFMLAKYLMCIVHYTMEKALQLVLCICGIRMREKLVLQDVSSSRIELMKGIIGTVSM